jgi:asparagine synthase (glutamine-hydrolysing)
MCSILVTNLVKDLFKANRFLKNRGPDATNILQLNGYSFLHNLLSLTGSFAPQPYVDMENQIVCLFNGEIYNYNEFGAFPSDGGCLIPAYLKHGENFPQRLDGEFAIVLLDFKKNRMLLATDTFATKPLWVATCGRGLGVATYESGLKGLGFSRSEKLPANRIFVYDLGNLKKIHEADTTVFELEQDREDFEGWFSAFREAIRKRACHSQGKSLFMGLSCGYDSGAIACELAAQKMDFKAYTVSASEDLSLIEKRHKLLKNTEIIRLSKSEYEAVKKELQKGCEQFWQLKPDGKQLYNMLRDQAAVGLAVVCKRATGEGRRIYFSGQGADEIMSDYGMNGQGMYGKPSQLGGIFPEDLRSVFPWKNFFDGAQRMFLAKEEHVVGTYGVEARYPYLDKRLVQEFLRLSPKLKNAHYKAPLREYFVRNNYPFAEGVKMGFFAAHGLTG